MIQNAQFMLFCTFFHHFPLKWSKMIWNAQLWPFCTVFNLFPPKWSEIIQNAQFWLFHTFLIFLHQSHLKLFRMINFACSIFFPSYTYQSVPESFENIQCWPFCIVFQSFCIKVVKNMQKKKLLYMWI